MIQRLKFPHRLLGFFFFFFCVTQGWITDTLEYSPEGVQIALVGTKADLKDKRQVREISRVLLWIGAR